MCAYALFVNFLPRWIIDTGATRHIVQDHAVFVDFHYYLIGLHTVVLRNDNDRDVLGIRTYQLKLYGGNALLLHHALYAPRVQCSYVTFVSLMRLGFSFEFCPDSLNILYNDNLFIYEILKGDFIILNLDDIYSNTSSHFISFLDSLLSVMLDLAMWAKME